MEMLSSLPEVPQAVSGRARIPMLVTHHFRIKPPRKENLREFHAAKSTSPVLGVYYLGSNWAAQGTLPRSLTRRLCLWAS